MNADAGIRESETRRILWVLLLVYIFNFLDRQIVNILAEPISRDLHLTDFQIGLMTGLAFALFYTVLGIPIARHAGNPRSDRGRLIAGALAIWSIMTTLCGLAQNFTQLLLARIGVGVGEAGCTPAAHSLIADRVAPDRRARAMAFYALGIPIGSLLGMIIGGQLADAMGWRSAFQFVGLAGLPLVAVVLWMVRDTGRPVKKEADRASDGIAQILLGFVRSPTLMMLIAAASASSFLSYGKSTWTTIFFQRTHGMSAGDVGFWFGLWGGLAGVAGTWLGGQLADRFGRNHLTTAPAIGMALAVPLALASYQASDWRTALALLMLPTLLNSLYYGPVYASTQGLVPQRHRALASALLLFCQNLIGLGLGPTFFGKLSDLLKPEYGAESVRYVLYGAACLGLIPAVLFWLLRGRLAAEIDRHST